MARLVPTARRALFVSVLVGSGACALAPAARVAGGEATRTAPRAEVAEHRPVVEGVEERFEPRGEPEGAGASEPPALAAEASEREEARAERRPPVREASPRSTEPAAKPSPSEERARAEAPAETEKPRREKRRRSAPSLDVDVRGLGKARCRSILDGHGVAYEVKDGASKEHLYVKPTGDVGGVSYVFEGRREVHEVMDCRLVVALLKWSPLLRERGVERIRHLSVYRPDARVARSGKPSGHASALAIDVRFVEIEGGRTLDVVDDWGNRARGVAPCDEGVGERDPSSELREITCEAIEAGLFQTVITPHRDKLHENHVHLELVPGVDWTFIR